MLVRVALTLQASAARHTHQTKKVSGGQDPQPSITAKNTRPPQIPDFGAALYGQPAKTMPARQTSAASIKDGAKVGGA